MQEMDKLKRARMYMEKLAEGIDPITDMELPSDTVLNNVRLSRCFCYVAGVLGKLIDAGGEEALRERQGLQPHPVQLQPTSVTPPSYVQAEAGGGVASSETRTLPPPPRKPFSLTQDQIQRVRVDNKPVELSVLCRKLNALKDPNLMRSLTTTKITNWLVRNGYLQDQYDEDARKRVRFPTDKGNRLGISFQTYYTYKMKYNATAQRFVLDHMEEITRPTERTWGWGGWQARRTSSPWASGLQSVGRSYAEAAWKESTADESRAGDGMMHTALQIPHTEYPKSKAEGNAPVGSCADTTATQPIGEAQGADTALANTGEANDATYIPRDKLWQAAHSVLDSGSEKH